ncbi:MAG: lytic transglycosylase domain-containing protein [Chitinophagaceae bacterium]|nr:lytic transglycosylase domain-containing protein [Oligoflexus sp.]
MERFIAPIVALLFGFNAVSLHAETKIKIKTKPKSEILFPSSPLLEKKVKFWEKVFTNYSSEQMLLHDKDTPDLIVSVFNSNEEQSVDETPKAYSQILSDFAMQGEDAKKLSAQHQKIWKLYSHDSAAKSRLLSGRVELRTQLGLSDIFNNAALRAQLYLPHMEKIFKENGLPPELTRIPFVESMFNVKAKSKVGASGIWQLMPAAARPHIAVTKGKDERNSPLKATYAAAKILKANYAGLKTWPLAITAYNHGKNGVQRGVTKLGSSNLADLILSYRSPSFGFASQNFYAEFLAAQRTYGKWQQKQLATASR